MNTSENIRMALSSIFAHKMRSILTMLELLSVLVPLLLSFQWVMVQMQSLKKS